MLSNDVVKRKLAAVTNTQMSINSLSTWVIQNKSSAEQIKNSWLLQLNKSDNDHRLTLLYVANDVIQNCRKRGNEMKDLSDVWRGVMAKAFEYFSHEAIKTGVDKVLNVWESRGVFNQEEVSKLKETMETSPVNGNVSPSENSEKAGKEFIYTDLVEAIKEYSKCENELKLKKDLLASSGLQGTDPEKLLEKVKERGHGHRARQELEEWTQLLLEYVSLQEEAIERRRTLLSLLDQSSGYYESQFREVTTVLKAYKDYQERIIAQKKRCQGMMKTKFPDHATNLTPVQSPTQSPELSQIPPQQSQDMQMSDSPSSSDDEALPNSLASFFAPTETPPTLATAGADGDLDSRLANILNPSSTSTPTTSRSRARASRWDTAEQIPPPPAQPPQPPPMKHHQNGGSNQVPEWAPRQTAHQSPMPPAQPNQYQMPASWGSPQKQNFPSQGFQNGPPSGPPRRQGPPRHDNFRGGFSGGRHFSPRTPHGHRPPRHGFNSDGPYGRGRGRGGRGGFFSPRGDRGMRHFR